MPVDRPTFSESWYRVTEIRPRLRSTVQVYRQHFRGQMWHVIQDPASNQFFRLNDAAYRYVGLLDGRKTVAEVWHICNEQLGDSAPTQGEVIQLLGQLHTSNLLQAELPPDTEAMFQRYHKRVTREVRGYLMNLLFIRIPLLDPDRFLDRWVRLFGSVFSIYGLIIWLGLIAVGLYFVAMNAGDLVNRATGILEPGNLGLLYASLVVVKIIHEFSHSFACKKFGRVSGTGGEVHVMGIMFLIFMPLPYMDASSAWAFRNKWHRTIVGAAGILTELAIASIAAIVWASTSDGTVRAIAYNIIFIASVSTLLFNGNPLLRFDGYYILSDLVEIPNLWQRSRQYIYYLVKRYVWGVRQPQNPAHSTGERGWFVFYGIASTVYRVFICIRILLFLGDRLPKQLFFVAIALSLGAMVTWVLVPLGKFLRYLATNGELLRVRGRAVGSTVGTVVAIIAVIGMIPMADRGRVEGVVEPARLAMVHTAVNGFVQDYLPSGRPVSPDGPPLLVAVNPELDVQRDQLLAERRRLQARRRIALTQEVALAQIYAEQIDALEEQIARVEEQLALLSLKARIKGTWVSPNIEVIKGAYLEQGDAVGLVASLDDVIIRAVAPQSIAALIITEIETGGPAAREVEIRLKGRPDIAMGGMIGKILPAGQEDLPSAALGYAAGGPVMTKLDDRRGTLAAEPFFEIRIAPDPASRASLMSGQRVVVRFEMSAKPLAAQWWRSLLQLFQRRFHV